MKKKLSRATIYRTRRVGVLNNIKNMFETEYFGISDVNSDFTDLKVFFGFAM